MDNCEMYSWPARQALATEKRDQNGDGVVDMTDLMLTFAAAEGSGGVGAACDINGDGVCDILDTLMVSNFLATGSCS